MRTTLTLADDILLIARRYARRESISLGEALSRLAREGHRAMTDPLSMAIEALQPLNEAMAQPKLTFHRYPELPSEEKILTAGEVRRLMEEMGPYRT